jgi:hypothetical protein
MTESAAVDAAKNAFNSQGSTTTSDNKKEILKQQYGKKGGQMKKGGFTYGDITYPFIM